MRTTLSKITVAIALIVLAGCEVRTTNEVFSRKNANRPRIIETATNPNNPSVNLPDRSTNNNSPNNNNNSNNNNNNPETDSGSSGNSPNGNSNNSNNNRPNDSRPFPTISIPKIIIKIVNRQVPESSSISSLLIFGLISSLYFGSKKIVKK